MANLHGQSSSITTKIPYLALSERPKNGKVGLVFSGGAARGLAHIGVLRALEQNGIPIDCITGTSMGAMIGGLYAAGYTVDEIEEIAVRESQRWLEAGLVLTEDYYFNPERVDGTFISVPLALRDNERLLPEYILSDHKLNLGLNEYLTGASGRAKDNFDSLFVPYRCMVSDLFDGRSIVLSRGSLAFAVRASAAVPAVLPAMTNDSFSTLFDGGVYNNFPVDVMEREFHPEHIIGVHVAAPPISRADYEKRGAFLERLLDHATDQRTYQKMPPWGVFIQPDLGTMSYSDFSTENVKLAIRQGYESTMACIDDIKQTIPRTITADSLNRRRAEFRRNWPPLDIESIRVSGVKQSQQKYAKRILRLKEGPATFDKLDRAFLYLKTDGNYLTTYPELLIDTLTQRFKLNVNLRPSARFAARFGGGFFSPNDYTLSLGAQYTSVGAAGYQAAVDISRGSFQNTFGLRTRLSLFGIIPAFGEAEFRVTSWELQKLGLGVLPNRKIADIRNDNIEGIFSVGFKYRKGSMIIGAAFHRIEDQYFANPVFTNLDTVDVTTTRNRSLFIKFEQSSLNRKMYPTRGTYTYFSFRYNTGFEDYNPGSVAESSVTREQEWFQARFRTQSLMRTFWRMNVGLSLDAAFSSLGNYTTNLATLLSSPKFLPLQDSPYLYQPRLYSKFYVAPGVQLALAFTEKFQLRGEFYWMQRLTPLNVATQKYKLDFNDRALVATGGVAYQTPIGPLGLFLNYYEGQASPVRIMFHLGYLIFSRHPWD